MHEGAPLLTPSSSHGAIWCRYVWYLYIACNMAAAAFVAFVVPETAGKQLES